MLSVRKTEENDDSETINDELAAPVFDFVVWRTVPPGHHFKSRNSRVKYVTGILIALLLVVHLHQLHRTTVTWHEDCRKFAKCGGHCPPWYQMWVAPKAFRRIRTLTYFISVSLVVSLDCALIFKNLVRHYSLLVVLWGIFMNWRSGSYAMTIGMTSVWFFVGLTSIFTPCHEKQITKIHSKVHKIRNKN